MKILLTLFVSSLIACPTLATAQSYWDPFGIDASPGSGGTGNWDTTTTNWWVSGGADSTWTANNTAFFEGTNGIVTLDGSVTADGLTFTAAGYSITNFDGSSTLTLGGATPTVTVPAGTTGIGCILAGSSGLTVSGPGNLVLAGADTFTGTTAIGTGSMLTVGNSGSLVPGNKITNNGTFNYNGLLPQSLSGIISGTGALMQSGPGTLSLSGVNTYTGGTEIFGGELMIGVLTELGASGKTISFNSNGILYMTIALSTGDPITVNSGGGVITLKGVTANLSGVISGPGTLSTAGDDFSLSTTGNNSVSNFNQTAGNRVFIDTAGALGVSPNFVTVHLAGVTGALLSFQNTAPTNPLNPMYFGSGSSLSARSSGGYAGMTVSTTNAFFPSTGVMVFNRDSGSSGVATMPIVINGNYPVLTGGLQINLGGGTAATTTGTVTLNGAVSDGGYGYSLTVDSVDANSPGNFILNGTNTYTGDTTVTAGNLTIGPKGDLGDTGSGTGGVYAGGIEIDGTLINASALPQTLSGPISGAGTLTQSGPGTLILNSSSGFSGTTAVNGGVLQLGDATANNGSVAGNITVTAPGVLTFGIAPGTSPQTTANSISGTGEVLVQQAGDVEVFSGTVSASTTISTGTLQLSGTLASATVTIENGATFQPQPASSMANAKISIAPGGMFDVSQDEPFTLTSGELIATGTTASPAVLNGASAGIINLETTIAVPYDGVNTPLTFSWSSGTAGTVNLTSAGGSASFLVTNLTGTAFAPGSYPLFHINGTVAAGSFAASVAGSGVAGGAEAIVQVTSGGAVSLVIKTPPSDVWNGTDFATSPNWSDALNWVGGVAPSTAGDNVTFAGTTGLSPNMDVPFGIDTLAFSNNAGAFTLVGAGGSLAVGNGVSDASTSPQVVNIPVLLTGGNSPWVIENSSSSITVNGAVSDQGNGLTLTGAGTLTLSSNNPMTGSISNANGTTVVVTGDLGDNGSGGLYAGAIADNGTFDYSGTSPQTFSGPIAVGTNATFSDNYGAAHVISGAISVASGGSFSVGTATAGAPLTLPTTPITNNGAITLNLFLNNVTLSAALSGTGTLTQSGENSTLTLGNAANSYSGGTTINGSPTILSIAADGALGTGPLTFANGGELKNTGTLLDSRPVVLTPGSSGGPAGLFTLSGGNVTLAGTISGGGGMSEGGADFIIETTNTNNIGTLTETANRLFINTQGALGGGTNLATINVTGGLLIFQSNAPTAPLNAMTFASGTGLTARLTSVYPSLTVNTSNATFPSSGTIVFNSDADSALTGPLTVNGNYPVLSGSLTIQVGASTSTGAIGTVGNATINGSISDEGAGDSLTKTAPGAALGNLILTGTNSYSGGTTISAGGFTLGGAGDLGDNGSGAGSYAGAVLNNGFLTNATSANQTWSGGLSGTGTLTQSGSGTLTLTAGEGYTGATTISGGTLALGAGGSIDTTPSISIGAGGTFDVTGADPYVLSGSTTLSASGAGMTPGIAAASINDAAAGATISLGSQTINLTITPTSFSGDTAHPALYIPLGALTLSGNTITVKNAATTPLGAGTYTLIQVGSGNISGTPNAAVTVTGTGIGLGGPASIVVSGGSVNLVIAGPPPPPAITGFSLSGTTLSFSATNGTANGNFVLLESTNLALPPSKWTPVLTNTFNGSGDINVSTNVSRSNGEEYYILEEAP